MVSHADGLPVESLQIGIRDAHQLRSLVEQLAVETLPAKGFRNEAGNLFATWTLLARGPSSKVGGISGSLQQVAAVMANPIASVELFPLEDACQHFTASSRLKPHTGRNILG